MGATGWDYFVPYQANITCALQQLRNEVFIRGDYESDDKIEEQVRQMCIDGRPRLQKILQPVLDKHRRIAASCDESVKHQLDALIHHVENHLSDPNTLIPKKRAKRKPKTISALLKRQAACGTHSILDILRISPVPAPYAVSPLSCKQLVELFGTEKPSHKKILEVYRSGSMENHLCEPWQGIYMIAFRYGKPNEVFFAGCSGD